VLTTRCCVRLYLILGKSHPSLKAVLDQIEPPRSQPRDAQRDQNRTVPLLRFNMINLVTLLDVTFLALC